MTVPHQSFHKLCAPVLIKQGAKTNLQRQQCKQASFIFLLVTQIYHVEGVSLHLLGRGNCGSTNDDIRATWLNRLHMLKLIPS